jgi:hypothetical protein
LREFTAKESPVPESTGTKRGSEWLGKGMNDQNPRACDGSHSGFAVFWKEYTCSYDGLV